MTQHKHCICNLFLSIPLPFYYCVIIIISSSNSNSSIPLLPSPPPSAPPSRNRAPVVSASTDATAPSVLLLFSHPLLRPLPYSSVCSSSPPSLLFFTYTLLLFQSPPLNDTCIKYGLSFHIIICYVLSSSTLFFNTLK